MWRGVRIRRPPHRNHNLASIVAGAGWTRVFQLQPVRAFTHPANQPGVERLRDIVYLGGPAGVEPVAGAGTLIVIRVIHRAQDARTWQEHRGCL
jgi:hypothetical protein